MSNKVYVDVLAEFSKDGLLIPKEITWEDGRKYEITRVKDKRRVASTRAGGVGERYTCVVDGKEIFLFYEDNNMWFMSRIENGRANCTVPQLYVISQILGCSVDYLLFGKQRLTISQEQADSIKGLIETFTK